MVAGPLDQSLERSACTGCPYQSRQRWAETKRRWPMLFAEVVEIDSNLRGKLAFAKEPYLHPRRLPLAQAGNLDEAGLRVARDPDGFGNECEGTAASDGTLRGGKAGLRLAVLFRMWYTLRYSIS